MIVLILQLFVDFMGRLSEAIFGRTSLPESCIIYGGAYVPERKEWIRSVFDKWQRIEGYWGRHSYAYRNKIEYLLIFNVYGPPMVLEIFNLLKDGGAKKVFFIGSMGGKDLPVGKIVLPSKVIDKTGFVSADDPSKQIAEPNECCLKGMRETLAKFKIDYVEGETVAVPCVFHNIQHISNFIEQEKRVLGMEIETSAFYHYAQKEGLESYALLYVSDNRQHDIISKAKDVREARKKSLKMMTLIATEILR
jgi:purine-nucleoside phosphorylase